MSSLQKIEVYCNVELNNASISEHAIDRSLQRFNLQNKNRNKVAEWIRNKLKYAEFNSTVSSPRFGIARLFVNEDVALVLDIHKDIVLTVYKLEVRKRVKSKIYSYIESECKRVSRIYNKKNRSYTRKIADLKIEKATLERDLLRVRKPERTMSIQGRINALDMSISEMLQELSDLQVEMFDLKASLTSIEKQL